MSQPDTDRIRVLNDQLRTNVIATGAYITPGIAALGDEAVARLVTTISTFDDFCLANDPHGEHDFGCFEFDEINVIFKIDYYDLELKIAHCEDSADPMKTTAS